MPSLTTNANPQGISGEPVDKSLIDRRVIIGLAILLYILGALLSQKRAFDQDEFLHLHIAWSISKGLIPFRDFFDHYTPLFHVLLSPLFQFFKVETNVGDAVAFIFFARKLMWLVSGVILMLTFWLGKVWRNTDVGYVAVIFLLCTEAYWNTTLEIRPDSLSVVFLLLYLITIARAGQPDREDAARKWMFALSGIFLALGFLTIQKLVYAFPGLAVGSCWYIFGASGPETRRLRLVQVAYELGGFCAPLILTAAYFYFHGALTAFVHYNFLFYLGVTGFSPYHNLHQFIYQHPYLSIFGGAGLICSLWSTVRSSSPYSTEFILAPAALSLIIGLFLIPVPHYQYFVIFLPLVAVFAATFLVTSVATLVALRDPLTDGQWVSIAALSALAISVGLVLIGRGAGSHWPLFLMVGYWTAVALASMGFAFMRAPTFALVFFLIGISVGPLKRLYDALALSETTPQIEEIRYIVNNTTPAAIIMDGFQGSGLYRPHAYFYWFLPYNDRERLTESDKQQLLDRLHSGSIAPKLVLFDKNLRDISPAVTKFFEHNYEPTGTGIIWKHKTTPDAEQTAPRVTSNPKLIP